MTSPCTPINEEHFVEAECGVGDSAHFRVGVNDYIVAGFEDGSLHLYNATKGFGNSYTRVRNTKNLSKSTASPYDQFLESNYEHADAVMSVEMQPTKETPMILTASKDGVIFLWSINPLAMPNDPEDEMMHFQCECSLNEPLTKAKWLSETEILVSTTSGHLYSMQVSKDSQNIPFLDRAVKVY